MDNLRVAGTFALLLASGCAAEIGTGDPGAGVTPESTTFSFQMAGALVLADDPLDGSAAQLAADHFSYVGQYAVNGCQNDVTPYSCSTNGCNYPGNPASSEIPTYGALRDWLAHYQAAGLYAGLWGVSYQHPEAEGHCIAEVANTLRGGYGVTPAFIIVDGEKSFETNQGYSQRFVDEFNRTLAFPIAKGYTPECHNEVPFGVWLSGGFTSIMPMAYWDDPNGGANPSYCLSWLASHGVPRGQSQVMLDGYRHGTPHPWSAYADDIASFGSKGFSVWRTVSSGEWDQWKGLIETRPIAVYGSGGCTPSCAGKSCGDDGCGGSCGGCPSGQSCSGGSCTGAPPPSCGALAPGQGLHKNQHLPSCDGRFALWMQGDGNLVVYEHTTPLWATHTGAGDTAWMQNDGNFVLYATGGKALWSSGTYGHPGASLAMQNDGNLVVYGPGGKPLWASNTCCH